MASVNFVHILTADSSSDGPNLYKKIPNTAIVQLNEYPTFSNPEITLRGQLI